MKKILLLLIITILSNVHLTQSQITMDAGSHPGLKNISQEKIFIHHNSSLLLTGENLYYKIYCINSSNNKLSDFSKIAYVELIGKDKTLVFKHKIILKKGEGQGDFFIPTSVVSGNYKLIAYTQWMRNGELSNYYQSDISIINPFQENQTAILQKNGLQTEIDSLRQKDQVSYPTPTKKISKESGLIQLKTNANTYKTRAKVTLDIFGLQNDQSYGNYSVSVRKIDSLQIPEKQTALSFYNANLPKTTSISLATQPLFLPELRGELLSGKVFLKETNTPANNVKVALSIPGENYIFKVANTNPKGIYYFNIDQVYDSQNANIYLLDDHSDKFELIPEQQTSIDYDAIDYFDFKITPAAKEYILNYSIQNQIENAYASERQDSIKNIWYTTPFFYNKAKNYILDDFTRFKTLKETFIEIIPEVYTSQRNDNFTFHVRVYDMEIESGLLPLVIIDGNLIQDQTELMDFNCNKIKQISVVSDLYMLGSQIFKGIISLNTFNGDYKSMYPSNNRLNIELSKPMAEKSYFNKVYDEGYTLNRIPDYRRQLLWTPNFDLFTNKETIAFYTSDLKGTFEICLEGFNTEGKPVSLKKIITVN